MSSKSGSPKPFCWDARSASPRRAKWANRPEPDSAYRKALSKDAEALRWLSNFERDYYNETRKADSTLPDHVRRASYAELAGCRVDVYATLRLSLVRGVSGSLVHQMPPSRLDPDKDAW